MAPVRSFARSDAEMMAFMAPSSRTGVAEPSVSGYSARPDRDDHVAYGNEHMLYS
ncbi:hypothetical protein GCM10010270_00930 [Streptomyces violaceus]|nr:hypothetical protein GCM10010270_00930 [Streptomyces janthinus]